MRTNWIVVGVSLALVVGCGSDNSKKRARGATAAPASGQPPLAPPPPGTPPPPPAPPAPLPTSATLTDLGAPAGGLPVNSDLTTFDGKLWMVQSVNPLGSFGAQVWTYDDTGTFTRVLDDATSQGYLRARVFGGKLYVPDGDPNGLAPGIVWVFDDAATPPTRTTVDGNVHAFDVAELNGQLYTSGGLDTGQSSLNRYDPVSGSWTVFSQGTFSRLKYMGVLDGAILASKRTTGGSIADFVQIDASGQQAGLSIVPGEEALTVCVEEINGFLYMTLSASQGVSHVRLETGGLVTALTGISGALLFDYVLHSDGNIYAVGSDLAGRSFVYGSSDGVAFTRLVDVADLRFGRVGSNADGRPSVGSFNGKVFCGSSTNGKLYRLD